MKSVTSFAFGIGLTAVLAANMAAALETCVENNTTLSMGVSFLQKGETKKEGGSLAPGEKICEEDYEGELEIFIGGYGEPALSFLKLQKGGQVKVVERAGGYFLEQRDAEGDFISAMKIRRAR